MDDLDLKQALRRYMEAGEPPFPLTASQLISEGKRQGRRRLGLSLGSATAATTLAILASFSLMPGGTPVLDHQGCDWQLPAAQWPIVHPSYESAQAPASPAEEIPLATPSSWPSEFGSFGTTPWPSDQASEVAVSSLPDLGSAPAVRTEYWGSVPPTGRVRGDVDQSRVDVMACYLKREMIHLFPQASFAPPSAPAMHVIRQVRLEESGWEAAYTTGAYVIQGDQHHGMVWVSVQLQPANLRPIAGEEVSTTPDGHTVYVYRSGSWATIRLATGRSLIIVDLGAQGITVEQGIAFANASELDLYR